MENNENDKYSAPTLRLFHFNKELYELTNSQHKTVENTEEIAPADPEPEITSKTIGELLSSIEVKPPYSLNPYKHKIHRKYAIAFQCYQNSHLTRVERRILLRKLYEDENKECSGFCFEEICVLYGTIADLRIDLERYYNTFGDIKKDKDIREKMILFADFMTHLGITIKPSIIKRIFFKICKTINEVDIVRASNNYISNIIGRNLRLIKKQEIENTKRINNVVQRVFGCVDNVDLNKDYIMTMFGESCLKLLNDKIAFYWNTMIDFQNVNIKMVHVDGRYYSNPSGWKQTFELVAVLEKDNLIKSCSVAFALLDSAKTETYEIFFKKVKDLKFCKFNIMTSDFEIAISNAAKKIFPKISVQGCYYHYRNNLLNMISKIQRRYKQIISIWVINLLSILPFMHKPTCYLELCINDIWNTSENLYESLDFKILIYVYSTYIVRLKGMFININPEERIRTNNTCEGRNSVLAKNLPFKPQISDLIDFIGHRFKQDAVKLYHKHPNANEFDKLILQLHNISSVNYKVIIRFCKEVKCFNFGNAKNHLSILENALKENETCHLGSEEVSKLMIDKHVKNYKNFKNIKRINYNKFMEVYKSQQEQSSKRINTSNITVDTELNSGLCSDINFSIFSDSDNNEDEIKSANSFQTKDQHLIINQKAIMKTLINMNDKDFLDNAEKYISKIASNVKLLRVQRSISKINKFEKRRQSK